MLRYERAGYLLHDGKQSVSEIGYHLLSLYETYSIGILSRQNHLLLLTSSMWILAREDVSSIEFGPAS